MEPIAMQYAQQAVLEAMKEAIEQDDICSWLISDESQVPNQELALKGSLDGSLATLDLSEASDRVSNQHVRGLLANHPHLFGLVDACRSRKADVPGHGVIRLAKFASMGSALCFPFESMVFATLVFLGIERKLNRQITRRDIKSYRGKVRIYGDDIIVPAEFVPSVISVLETFGFRVNTDKSFWTGKFRESCGKEYFSGVDVSIIKLREMFPTSRKDVSEIVSTVSLRNKLFTAGFVKTVDLLDEWIERLIPFPFIQSETSPVLGRLSYSGQYTVHSMHPTLHVPLVKGVVLRAVLPRDHLDGDGALLKFFLKRGSDPLPREHLERSGRPDA
jgi:hypothetical protein